jgi:hypothetical protein
MNFLQKLTNWYFSKRALPYWGVLTLDCLIVLISAYIGNYLELRSTEISMKKRMISG